MPGYSSKGRLTKCAVVILALMLGCTGLVLNDLENSQKQLLKSDQKEKESANIAPNPSAEVKVETQPELLFPSARLVALYGTPGDTGLGALGQQSVDAAVERVKKLAAEYQTFSAEPVRPAFEIITTIAHSGPTPNNDYSREVDVANIEPWVAAAKSAGIYVILDLQPGRSDFLTQAKMYESLLKQPHVGLALDPEWRLKPNHLHLINSGSVEASEVNSVSTWLADLIKDNNLPKKVFLLHQFKLKMLPDRQNIDTARTELVFSIQMDGQGSQGAKLETWRSILQNPPPNTFYGWKNFYKKDLTLLSPEATMKISPTPWFITYQ